jgi:Xaa-Pro aminopeptidase
MQASSTAVREHRHARAVMDQEAAIDAAMAGGPVSDIDRAARRVIDAAGFAPNFLLRSGHSFGGFRCADVVLVGERAQRLPAAPKDIASCTVILTALLAPAGVARRQDTMNCGSGPKRQ